MRAFAERFGSLVSAVFLTIFYFTVLAVFAVPYRLAALFRPRRDSGWQAPSGRFASLADFEREG
jgi:hypothetical protein